LYGCYLGAFDQIHADYPGIDMLDIPLWKWTSLVEAFLWRHADPEKHDEIRLALERPVDFTWANGDSKPDSVRFANPAHWQTNKQGESLLSVHAKKG